MKQRLFGQMIGQPLFFAFFREGIPGEFFQRGINMPNTYAHYRFGRDVYHRLPETFRVRIRRYPRLYDIGLHGPDLLFYYRPLQKNPISRIGYEMHEWTGRRFFNAGAEIVNRSENRDAAWAYLMGFLCHYILDSTCHPYVGQKMMASSVGHSEIEGAFDRYLMVLDGRNPVTHIPTNHIVPDPERAAVIAPFFSPADPAEIYEAMNSFIRFNRLLIADTLPKRLLIYSVMKVTGVYPGLHGMVITRRPDPRFEDSDRKLRELYREALSGSRSMFEMVNGLISGENELDARFDHTFGEN